MRYQYHNHELKKSFTLIEILVVATIIGLLASIGAVSYTQFVKQSRDAKRKADLEQIRAAIEMYRSNKGYYPTTANFTFSSCTSPGSVSDGSSTYLSKAPNDPKCSTTYYYYYEALPDSPSACDNVAPPTGSYCTDYTIAARLESTTGCSLSLGVDSCGTANACNYCVGPYGQK